MKVIFVENCGSCPYRKKDAERNVCLLTMEALKDLSKIHKSCTLQSSDAKQKSVKKPTKKKSEVTDEMLDVLKSTYDMYKKYCPKLPPIGVLGMTASKQKSAFIGIVHCGMAVEQVLKKAGESDFLCGSTGWKADFLWIFRPSKTGEWNSDKILSGKYENKFNRKTSEFVDKQRTYGEEW